MSDKKSLINLNFKAPADVIYRIKILAYQNHMKEKDLLNKILRDYADKNVLQTNSVNRI